MTALVVGVDPGLGGALALLTSDGVLGRRRLSHTIAFRRGRYVVTAADGTVIGAFATLARAHHASNAASAEAHAIDREDQKP